jgi:hypothetical protein
LLEVCDSLAQPQHNKKALVNTIFERSSVRQKNLEARDRETRRAKASKKESQEKDGTNDNESKIMMLRGLETEFLDVVSLEDLVSAQQPSQ